MSLFPFGDLWCTNARVVMFVVPYVPSQAPEQCCKLREHFPGALGDWKCRVSASLNWWQRLAADIAVFDFSWSI